MTSTHQGSCQCGTIRYTISGPLPSAYACHCGECKQQSGSAFSLSIPIEWARMTVEGEVTTSEGRAFSGKPKLRCFCPSCGNRMWHRTSADSQWITLKAGTLACAETIEPRGHLWVSKKQPWIILDPALPSFETQPEDVHVWRTQLT